MKSLMLFLCYVLDDIGTWCGTSTERDKKTCTLRFEQEGLSFLSITLPRLGKDLEKGLDLGRVSPSSFEGFSKDGTLPRFLGGLFDLVFDRKTGWLWDKPDITAIWALRQFTLMWAKILLPVSPEREKAAINGFITCEKEIRERDSVLTDDFYHQFDRVSSLLWAQDFTSIERKLLAGDIIPKHGPGATAERLSSNGKWRQREWPERLDRVFPHWEFLESNRRYFDHLADVRLLEPGSERPVRVITVPKTLKSPRIIAIEPCSMQFMQQGLLATFRECFQENDSSWSLIGWGSQVPNQHLAYTGSLNGDLATLDLSEASDRVSNQHVRRLFRRFPHLSEAVDASRSRKADVPGFGVIRLAKFASMGSALCFPIESIVFMTVVFVGIERELNRPLTKRDVKSLLGRVRTFGDDIIVPKEYVHSVIRSLEDFGLKVNLDKSFWNGKFRESCGSEFYDGQDVSIVRVRRLFPASRRDAQEFVSTVSLRNQLYKSGLWKACRYLDEVLESLGPFPRVEETSPVLGRHSFLGPDLDQKLCPELHRPLVKGFTIRATTPVDELDGYAALTKCLTLAERKFEHDPFTLPNEGVDHLERSGRPLAVRIKLGWGPPV